MVEIDFKTQTDHSQNLGKGLETVQKLIKSIKVVPLEMILSVFGKIENQNSLDEIEIPWASTLQKIGGVTFAVTEWGLILELPEYVDLMCGIIDTVEDVKILHDKKTVIKDNLSHDQITNIFNRIKKSSCIDTKSGLEKAVDEVYKHYGSRLGVKAWRSIKKCRNSSWNFVQAS
ncbi:unnamed protein product [Ilex paraguariensis]|uniref:Uncharacterized protein n=1 Tax=Ilex paraguariensis TaxID=185542 RepID=A0ABC8RVM7_9AQUA